MTMPPPVRALRIFLCHAARDKAAVRELSQRLQTDGFEVWWAEEHLLPGQDWRNEISKALRRSDVIIVCLSSRSITKAGYVQKEIKFALDVADEQPEGALFLIPLKLEECEVPQPLSRWQCVNLFRTTGYGRLLKALRFRAESLAAADASDSPSPSTTSSSVSNVSGGVNVSGDAQVGNDLVGRDKVIQATTYIEHATIVQSPPPVHPSPAMSADEEMVNPNEQTWGGGEFVRIPAGRFRLGSAASNPLAAEAEKPQHILDLPYDYWLARYAVTNEQFARFVAAAPYAFDQGPWQARADHPVVKVSWIEALAYCKWLDALIIKDVQATLAKIAQPSTGLAVRLPTEAEWEKAARGSLNADELGATDAREWPWGSVFNKTRCNSEEGGRKGTTAVGVYSPHGDSPYGIADLAGNVWEWTVSLWGLDLFQPQYRYPYQSQDGREKLDAPHSVYRVVRGGAFNSRASSVRAAYRYWYDPRARSDSLGFRVVIAPRLF